MSKPNLTVKLLVNKENQRVIFAEAGKEVVDFLFSLLALPVGTVTRLLADKGMVGSVGDLHDSLERLGDTYLQAGFNKNTLLKPTIPSNASCRTAFFLECAQSSSAKTFYRCDNRSYDSRWSSYVTDSAGAPCPSCKRPMTTQLAYVPPKAEPVAEETGGGGYVQGIVTYMVMDDLAVQPMSTISSVTLLKKFHVREVSSLEERTVELGLEEGLLLLKAAFQSKTVLTDVFLGRKRSRSCARKR